jgi:hypothetical protein
MRIVMAKKKNTDVRAQLLARAIELSGVAEVIRCSSSGSSVKVLFRVFEKRTWLAVLEYALSRAEGWSAHVCQQYFMRGGRLVYGWNFILQAEEDVDAAARHAAKHLTKAAQVAPKAMSAGPVDSYPLVGSSPRRTAKIAFDPRLPGPDKGGPSHKGAYAIRSGE